MESGSDSFSPQRPFETIENNNAEVNRVLEHLVTSLAAIRRDENDNIERLERQFAEKIMREKEK